MNVFVTYLIVFFAGLLIGRYAEEILKFIELIVNKEKENGRTRNQKTN